MNTDEFTLLSATEDNCKKEIEQIELVEKRRRRKKKKDKKKARSTYETRRIVITDGLGITERFQDRIGLDDLIFQRSFLLTRRVFAFLGRGTDGGKVRDYFLRVFSFSGTRFTGDQHGLIFTVCEKRNDTI